MGGCSDPISKDSASMGGDNSETFDTFLVIDHLLNNIQTHERLFFLFE